MISHATPPSEAWALAWAKSPDEDGAWLPLWRHMVDSAGVAEHLWDQWMPASVRELLSNEVGGPATARSLAQFLAAAHDVGKISEEFASQNSELRERMERAGFIRPLAAVSYDNRKQWPHGSTSARSLWEWLKEGLGRRGRASTVASVLAGHHGTYPAGPPGARPDEGTIWSESRRAAIDFALEVSGLDYAEALRVAADGLTQSAQVTLTGFVVVCDWIASNRELFPYDGGDGDRARARRAVALLDLPPPWEPRPPAEDRELFSQRFDLPAGATPRPVQLAAAEQARLMTEPELMLIEAPTGEGKTEAAFAAAEIIAATFGCGGVTIALPTCATSDAMFTRTLSWLERSVPPGTTASALLTHSRARFNSEYTGLAAAIPDTGLGGIYDEGGANAGAVTAHWWLRARKKSALADFTVGTIDQVLFLALQSRHLMLRHLGVVGKVVVLDEVHSADTYMVHFLDRALEWLGAAGVPVVALTATLTPARRRAMLAAYRRGRLSTFQPIMAGSLPEADLEAAAESTAFPLVVRVGSGAPTITEPASSGRSTAYQVEFVGDDLEDLVREVVSAVRDGACVIVVRNTVARAQAAYSELLSELGEKRTMLLHSRFILADRLSLEREVKRLLGPPTAGVDRPHGMVVVSTQVIESSLDIDADLMYSDLAPVDLLLQRAGRLHRHPRGVDGRPESVAEPRLRITGVSVFDEQGVPPVIDKGSAHVYGSAALLRAGAVLREHLESRRGIIESPQDIPVLVRDAYAPTAVAPSGWEDEWHRAEAAREESDADRSSRSATYLLRSPGPAPAYGWNSGASDEPSDEALGQAQVRDSENSLDVVVVSEREGRACSLPWLEHRAAELVDSDMGIDDGLARAVAMCTVSLPAWTFRGSREGRIIGELERRGIPGWQSSPWLKGVLALQLDEDLQARVGDLHFEYDKSIGLTVRVRGDE